MIATGNRIATTLARLMVLWVLGAPLPALAADEPTPELLQEARQKFNRALALQTAGDWAGALTLLKQVAEIKDTPQVRFNIALAEERLGQLVAALGDYAIAVADSRAQNASDVEQQAEKQLASLRSRIPYVVVQRGAGAHAATVTLDGVELGQAALDTKLPVDPGGHVIAARAAGHQPFSASVDLSEGEVEEVTVTLTPQAAETDAMEAGGTLRANDSRSNTLAWVVGGIGAASFVASGVFFVLRADAISELEADCAGLDCGSHPELKDTYDKGRRYTTLGNITLAGGVVGIGLAATLLLTSGGHATETSQTGVRVVPGAGGTLAGASLHTRF